MPIAREKVSSTNSGYKYKLLQRLGRLMIVIFAFASPRGNEISSICKLTYYKRERARQIIIILLLFFRFSTRLSQQFSYQKSSFLRRREHMWILIYGNAVEKGSCNVYHSIPLFFRVRRRRFIAADKKVMCNKWTWEFFSVFVLIWFWSREFLKKFFCLSDCRWNYLRLEKSAVNFLTLNLFILSLGRASWKIALRSAFLRKINQSDMFFDAFSFCVRDLNVSAGWIV